MTDKLIGKDEYGHSHSGDPNYDDATIIDITSRLPKPETEVNTELPIDTDNQVESLLSSRREKQLTGLLTIAIGSVIVAAVYPAVKPVVEDVHNAIIENKTAREATLTGVVSLVGWAVFYGSIPYLQNSKLGRYFAKKGKNQEES